MSKENSCPCDVIRSIFPTGNEKITKDHMDKISKECAEGRISAECFRRFFKGWKAGKIAKEVVPECYKVSPPTPTPPSPKPSKPPKPSPKPSTPTPSLPTPLILPIIISLGIIGLAVVLTRKLILR